MIPAGDILEARILIVDDQEENITTLEEMLKGAGYRSIASTREGGAACQLHRVHRYDLILLDLQMHGVDGFQVMEQLKEIETEEGGLPVLVIAAAPGDKLRALQTGARDFLQKPFDLAEVLVRVHNLIEARMLQAQLALHNATRLEHSQHIAGLGDWEYDFAQRRLVWSEEVYRILGISRKDSPPNSETFYRQVHPDDLALVHREKRAVRAGSRHVDFEHRIIRSDGQERHVRQIAEVTYDENGQALIEAGTIQDITERKLADTALRQSEERFKLVARAVGDTIWDWNISANTLWRSDRFLTDFGLAAHDLDNGIGAWTGLIHADERSRVIASIQQAIDAGQECWNADYRLRRKDGSYAFIQDRAYIVRDDAGKSIRMVGGMRDLTEQRKMEAQYLRAQRMESIGTLAGGIAHDLNNVLAPVLMAIELLKLDSVKEPRRGRLLDTIYTSSRRGADLVRQVLTFARGVDGARVAVRLQHLINELSGVISETFPRNIKIVSDVPKNLWPVQGDPTQLHQVLLNLTVNARDAMPHGGTLTLGASNLTIDAQFAGTSSEASEGTYVVLQVTDTGQGMSPQVRERIFDPFFTTKEVGKGTGIGLATVHTIVKSHGGFVEVESEEGSGTTFRIYLRADAMLRGAATVPPFPDEPPHGRDELVLVVDDEFSIRHITQQTLETFGYRVITASDGAEAVALYARQSQQIAVVITDMMMPVLDGAAAIQVLLRINPAVRIIAVRGIDVPESAPPGGSAGERHFLLKPYTAKTLLKLVRQVLDEEPATA